MTRSLTCAQISFRAAITDLLLIGFSSLQVGPGKIPFSISAAKEKSLDNQPPPLLFYRAAVNDPFLQIKSRGSSVGRAEA